MVSRYGPLGGAGRCRSDALVAGKGVLGGGVVHDEVVVRAVVGDARRPRLTRLGPRADRRQGVHTAQLGPVDAVRGRRHLDIDGLAGRREVLRGEGEVHTAVVQDAGVRKVPRVHGSPVVRARGRRGDREDRESSDDGDERREQRPEDGKGRAAPVGLEAWGRHRPPCRNEFARRKEFANAPIPHPHATEQGGPSTGRERRFPDGRTAHVVLPICFVPCMEMTHPDCPVHPHHIDKSTIRPTVEQTNTRIHGYTDRRIEGSGRDHS